MNYYLIRTCKRDEWISRLCYESFKLADMKGHYVFLLEDSEYELIPNEQVIYRSKADNFAGQVGVKNLINCFKQLNIQDSDFVFVVDSDIVLFDKIIPTKNLSGVGAFNGRFNHISGQMQILSGKLFNQLKALSISDIDQIVFKEMDSQGIDVADDTFISFFSDKNGYEVEYFKNKWIHYKFYQYNGRFDFNNIINEIKNDLSGK